MKINKSRARHNVNISYENTTNVKFIRNQEIVNAAKCLHFLRKYSKNEKQAHANKRAQSKNAYDYC